MAAVETTFVITNPPRITPALAPRNRIGSSGISYSVVIVSVRNFVEHLACVFSVDAFLTSLTFSTNVYCRAEEKQEELMGKN